MAWSISEVSSQPKAALLRVIFLMSLTCLISKSIFFVYADYHQSAEVSSICLGLREE